MRLPPFAASRPRSRDSMALLLGLAVALCGCSDDADDPTEPGPATHTFTVTLTNVSPRTGDLSAAVTLWDAGTEVDQWPGAAPRPACRRLPARLACGAMIIRDVPARSPIAPLLMVLAASLVACGGGGESPGADEGDDDAAEVNVFDFGRASGGGVGANLQRWIGQMEAAAGEQPTRGQFTADGMAGHVVALDGTDDVGSSRPMGRSAPSRPGYRLVGVVLEGPEGSLFFKLTGPAATARAMEADLLAMVEAARRAS